MKKTYIVFLSVIALLLSLVIGGAAVGAEFVGGNPRFDHDGNGVVDISDVTALLNYLAGGCTHSPVADAEVPATCLEGGLSGGSHCALCGEVLEEQTATPPLGHDYVGNFCLRCFREECTEGLQFDLVGDAYAVCGYEGTSDKVYIPAEYKGLPVTSVSNAAFSNVSGVSYIDVPEGVTTLGSNAFKGCHDLCAVSLPDSVTEMGSYLFQNCGKLITLRLPQNITEIPKSAFELCGSLTAVELPQGLTTLGAYAFSECASLVEIDLPASVRSIGSRAFYGCMSLGRIEIPEGVTAIGDYTFRGCSSLCEVVLPGSLRTIGSDAFRGCESLYGIDLPENLSSLGSYVFRDCTSLSTVVIPDNITVIGVDAFNNCKALRSVTLPARLAEIGQGAFRDCERLKSIVLPEGVTTVGPLAFHGCVSLIEVVNNTSLPIVCGSDEYGYIAYYAKTVHSGESLIENVDGFLFLEGEDGNYLVGYVGNDRDLVLPATCKGESYALFPFAFYNCRELRSVTIPPRITEIPQSAFANCTGLCDVTLRSSLKRIGRKAFENCFNLTSFTVPASLEEIGEEAFINCYRLYEVINNAGFDFGDDYGFATRYALGVHAGQSKVVSVGDFRFFVGNNRYFLLGYFGEDDEIVLPENYDGHEYEIAPYAFYHSDLVSVTVNLGVTDVGESAFEGCEKLENAVLSVGNIGVSAFRDCANLSSLTFGDNVWSIGSYAFLGCSSLSALDLSPSLLTIGTSAFENCRGIRTVHIRSYQSAIYSFAFRNCTSINTVNYSGSPRQWSETQISEGNDCLLGAEIYYYVD